VSFFGFSPRGRGKSKPLVHSPLPISHGTLHHLPPKFNGYSVELPTPPPLPPLLRNTHDKQDEAFSSHKVINMIHNNTTNQHQQKPSIITDTSSVMPRASSDVHFEGKIFHHLPRQDHNDNTTSYYYPNHSNHAKNLSSIKVRI
jgi:hypothetical protein